MFLTDKLVEYVLNISQSTGMKFVRLREWSIPMTTSALGRSTSPTSDSTTSSSDVVRQVAVVFAYVSTIVVNALANIVPIGGMGTGEVSDLYEVFFVPAGYVFSIWGLIYLGLGAYAVYQAIPAQRDNPRLRSIGWLFVLSCVFNSTWIFAWHYQTVGLSLLLIVGVLVTLIAVYARLYPSYRAASWAEKITTHWTFRIYLGWLTVATLANGTTYLDSIGYSGAPLTPALWAAALLVVATAIGLFFTLRLRDVAYTAVLVWAFIGIYAKFPDTAMVGYTALAMVALLAVGIVVAAVRSVSSSKPQAALT